MCEAPGNSRTQSALNPYWPSIDQDNFSTRWLIKVLLRLKITFGRDPKVPLFQYYEKVSSNG